MGLAVLLRDFFDLEDGLFGLCDGLLQRGPFQLERECSLDVVIGLVKLVLGYVGERHLLP
jgi:hypothetical protein